MSGVDGPRGEDGRTGTAKWVRPEPAFMSTESSVARRLGLAREHAGLAAGDVVVIVGLLLVGELSHGITPWGQPVRVLGTLVPFLIGWVVTAAVLGTYADRLLATPAWLVRTGAATWLGAAGVGLLLRGSPLFHGDVTWPFPLVITGLGLAVVVVWRTVAGRLGLSQ